jgi:hypothetical protein
LGKPREENAMKVRVDGGDAVLHITEQSVMFATGGGVRAWQIVHSISPKF